MFFALSASSSSSSPSASLNVYNVPGTILSGTVLAIYLPGLICYKWYSYEPHAIITLVLLRCSVTCPGLQLANSRAVTWAQEISLQSLSS